MNNINGLQNQIAEWSDKTFGDGQRLQPIIAKLKKEVEELYKHPCEDEFADCIILLLDAAWRVGISGDGLIRIGLIKLALNKKRKWGKPDKDGVIQHISDPPEGKEI